MVSTPQPHLHFLWPPPPLSSSPSPNKFLSSVLSLSSSSPTTIPNPRTRPRKPSTLSLAAPRAHSQPLTLSDQTLDETPDLQLQASTATVPLLDQQPFRRIFVQEPPWTVPSILLRGLHLRSKERPGLGLGSGSGSDADGVCERRRYNLLRRRQIRAETEAWQTMVEEYRELEREMCEKKLAPNLPHVKALFLGWFEPLRDAIAKDQKLHRSKKQKSAFAPNIDLLSPEKMAVIVMHKMMGLVMMGNDDGCVSVVQAALSIGMAIEQEVRIHSYLEKTKNPQRKRDVPCSQDSLTKEKELVRKRVKSLIKRKRLVEVQKLLRNEDFAPWGSDTQAKLGSRLIELLTETAYVQHPVDQAADCPPDVQPAFRHTFKTSTRNSVPKMARKHGVVECDPAILKGLDQSARHMVIPYVPMLIPPRKWKGYNKGGYLFLPSYVMRTHGSKRQEDAIRSVSGKNLSKVFEALDTLGGTKWRINKRVLSVVESIWDRGGNAAGLIDRSDVPIPEKPLSEDMSEIQKWRWSVKKAKKINQERHSQRCDTEIKLSVARRMKDEEGFYYPHNLDFRGRAYPMHPHLNHLSSDLCRGVLEFAEGRPLGVSGLHWLKIHLATVYGGSVDKLPHEGRLAFVEEHLHDIFDSAENPVTGNRWWIKAEDPFQCLAACMNLSEALRSSSPCTVISHLPIHQDGSCNGLQHYAALGRDSLEAAAVNLVAGEKPADVYSEIAARVQNIIERDSRKDPTDDRNALLANMLINQVDRKLVKQTVMTSVYGVTYIGAREQIKRRLEEKGQITDDRLLFSASCYAAKVTLTALGELFEAARGIMGWLGDCAKVIASEDKPVQWNTPLGLPVVQPYCKNQRHLIKTSLQVLALQRDGKSIDGRKQRSAFPPNFVHSLDGSHMMMTAVACRDAGLHFAGVHDSFWTHACDVDRMNCILREKFVELYNAPILEELLESFRATYPTLKFPPLPDRGDFKMEAVIDSTYFFN